MGFNLSFTWELSQKLTPYLFQNDGALYFEGYWKRDFAAAINFRCLIKLKDFAFQWKKNKNVWLARSEIKKKKKGFNK